MKASSRAGLGQGWHKQSLRHSNARKNGTAGGKYTPQEGYFIQARDNKGGAFIQYVNFKTREPIFPTRYVSKKELENIKMGNRVEG